MEKNDLVSKFETVMSFLRKENEIGQIRADIIEKVKERLDKVSVNIF